MDEPTTLTFRPNNEDSEQPSAHQAAKRFFLVLVLATWVTLIALCGHGWSIYL
jgi:hypothetical protein